jgi:hypothetical protein
MVIMTEPNKESNVTKITITREQMEEVIEKAATESNSDYYICPFCYARRTKEHTVVHKRTCTGLR